MRKCAYCLKVYSDTVVKCPECHIFLMTDVVSDLEVGVKGKRRTMQLVDMNTAGTNTVKSSVNNNSTPMFEPGRNMNTAGTNTGKSSVNNNSTPMFEPGRNVNTTQNTTRTYAYGGTRRVRTNVWGRVLSILRIMLPVIIIALAILSIILNWNSIRSVLRCLVVGAIIGGCLFTFLAIRFGRRFDPGIIPTGAIVGAIMACIFKYNILDVETELVAIVDGLAPCIIILVVILYMIRAAMR